MRALSVIHFPVFGGPHNQALRLAGPLRSRGWDTLVLLPDQPGNAAARLEADGVEVARLPLHRLRAVWDPRVHASLAAQMAPEVSAIRRLIRARSIDVVQIGGLVNPHAAIAASLEHVPVVWQLLDTRAPWPVALASMAIVRQLADVVMSTGRALALSHPGGRSLRDRLIPFFPPVDVQLFRPRPEDRSGVRSAWGVPDDAPVVGSVANLNPQKGILELVEVFERVRRRVPDARLVLVGAEYATHADYGARVRAALATAGLVEGREVILTGERSDVERQMAGFDIFAFTPVPRGEGISTVVLEAMAVGLPVVVTNVGALSSAIEDGVDGRLVPSGNLGSVAEAIVELLNDNALAERFRVAARAKAVDSFALEECVEAHVRAYEFALARRGRSLAGADPGSGEPVIPLACPVCRAPLTEHPNSLICAARGHVYPIVNGIPILVPDLDRSTHDEIDHHQHPDRGGAATHKLGQAAHFDRSETAEFEITRPHGTPRLHARLLREKFRRATRAIGPDLTGASALVVCAGSGMDAEFLERAGARVVATDLSLGAARRSQERATRYGLKMRSVVADVERLPFPDASFDLVFVHDGLHHLEDPERGLLEMARVARRWISVSEPARAAVTSLAVRTGMALDREEAGNRVERLALPRISDLVTEAGFEPLAAERYAMYYRHHPGALLRLLSYRGVLPIVWACWRIGNGLLGRWGNKLVLVALRNSD